MHPLNDPANKDPRMPELCPPALAFMDKHWNDDFESWGLVNPDEDPILYHAVLQLQYNHAIAAETDCSNAERSKHYQLAKLAETDIKALLLARDGDL